jgi:hypothetical protein
MKPDAPQWVQVGSELVPPTTSGVMATTVSDQPFDPNTNTVPIEKAGYVPVNTSEPLYPWQSAEHHGDTKDTEVRRIAVSLGRIFNGFQIESLNGVVCSIPDSGVDERPHRFWCPRCQRRWRALQQAQKDLMALVGDGKPECIRWASIRTGEAIYDRYLLGETMASLAEDFGLSERAVVLIVEAAHGLTEQRQSERVRRRAAEGRK